MRRPDQRAARLDAQPRHRQAVRRRTRARRSPAAPRRPRPRPAGRRRSTYAMPRPPPRLSSAQVDPVLVAQLARPGRPRGGRRPRSRRCRRSASRCASAGRPARSDGARQHPATASAASPVASEKPNFWSSCAVAMNSWVCASTPTVTRTSTSRPGRRCRRRAAASRSISSNESTTIRPTPASSGGVELGDRLVVAVQHDALRREARAQRHRQLAAGARRRARALPRRPSGRPSSSGTPCPRSRRRRPRERGPRSRGTAPGSRPRRGRSTGVPNVARPGRARRARRRVSTPSSRRGSTCADQTAGSSALSVGGSTGGGVGASVQLVAVQRAGRVRGHAHRLHPLGRATRRAGRGRSRAPAGSPRTATAGRALSVGDRLVALRQHPARRRRSGGSAPARSSR